MNKISHCLRLTITINVCFTFLCTLIEVMFCLRYSLLVKDWYSKIQKRSDWLCLVTWLGRSRFTEQDYWDISAPGCKQNLKNESKQSEPKSEYLLNQARSGALFALLLMRWQVQDRTRSLPQIVYIIGRRTVENKA